MSDDRARLEEVFSDLSELSPAERAARIEPLRAESPDLAAELESLLAAHDEAGSFLERLDATRAAELMHGEEPLSPPERAGPWRLVREIGRGGLGVVYSAERDQGGFEQRVAVKLIKRGMDSELILKRFHYERRILASLEHPNIARLIDGGMLEDGRPYFAMEYIEGVALTEWCDRNKATIGQRLKLYEQVCRAVQYAHARLIVHRDLKPANILVCSPDGGRRPESGGMPDASPDSASLHPGYKNARYQVKLLDFGIAKLLDEEGESGTALTAAGVRAMTPEYAAPEQVRGEPVSTATDVYALGVVLYELISGQHPFKDGADTRDSLAKAICETTPTLPSAAVTGDHKIAEARGSRPKALRRHLRGDLDNVVLMAMAKDPGRRYGSAEALAEDVRRHLEGLPVKARRETLAYRASRFLFRHRAGVVMAALVFSMLLAFVALLLKQQSETLAERDRARQAAERAEQTVEFLTTLLEQADPNRAQGADVTVRQVLDQAARSIDIELSTQPRLQAELQSLIGRVYSELGLYEDAESQLSGAIEKLLLLAPESTGLAATLARQSQVYVGLARWDEADRLARDSLEIRRRQLGDNDASVADSLISLAAVHYSRGHPDDGRKLIEQALELLDEGEAEALAKTLSIAAMIETDAGELVRAEQLARRAVEAWRDIDPPRTRGLAQALEAHAFALTILGQPEQLAEAEQLWLEAIEIERDLLGERHYRPAVLLGYLASTRSRLEDFEGGERALMEAFDVTVAALGPDHPDVSTRLNNIAVFYHRQAKWPEAIDYYTQSIELAERLHEPNHPAIGTTRAYLGLALHMAGDERAESVYRTALDELSESRTDEHEKIGNLRTDLGVLLAESGRYSEAEPELRAGLAIVQPIFGNEDQRTDSARAGLGFALCGLGQVEEGEALLRDSREWREKRYSEEHWRRDEIELYGAECLLGRDLREDAAVRLDVTLNRLAATQPDDHVLIRLGRRLRSRVVDIP